MLIKECPIRLVLNTKTRCLRELGRRFAFIAYSNSIGEPADLIRINKYDGAGQPYVSHSN